MLHADVGMVRGQLLDSGLAHEIDARISHVAHRDLVIAQHGNSQGRGHAGLALILEALVVDRNIGRVKHLRDEMLRGLLSLGLLESLQSSLHGQAACHFAALHSTDTISQDCDRSASALLLERLRLPKADEILVVLAGRTR